MSRMTHDEYYMKMANIVKDRGTCPRAKVGCVIVKDKQVVATGYNGAPRGMPHCDDVGCLLVNDHCIRVTHAEMNAMVFAGEKSKGATMYVTHLPCPICIKLCIQAGIKKVIYEKSYKEEDVKYWLHWPAIEVIQYESRGSSRGSKGKQG